MQRGRRFWLKLAALTPLMALYGSSSGGCQADTLRAFAGGVQGVADEIDGGHQETVGEWIDGLIEDL